MKRILLKLSGEALAGEKKTGFDEETVRKVALQVKDLVDDGIQVGIVIGGGNFWRGRSSENIDRTKADQIGMLATIMNCIYVSEIFRSVGMMTNILTPFECGSFTKLFSKDRANKYFAKGMVVFFAGGTGHPYFSTDTGVVLRAIEVEADVILLAKAIDGVYNADPAKDPTAKKYDEVSIDEVIAKNLQVLDKTADLSVYETNMNILYKELTELGFTCVKPGGTFYIFPKALEEDAKVFSQKALKYDLVLVSGDSFGAPGYFRMAYCVDTEKVERSLEALRKFVKTEYATI